MEVHTSREHHLQVEKEMLSYDSNYSECSMRSRASGQV